MLGINQKEHILGLSILLATGIVVAATVSAIPTITVYADGDNHSSGSNSTSSGREHNNNSTPENSTNDNNANMTSEEHQNSTNLDDNSTKNDVRNNHGKDNNNATNSEGYHRDNNTTTENDNSTDGRDHDHHSGADEKRQQYVSESAEQRHDEHVSSHAPITGPFLSNINYTLTASGNTTSVYGNTTSNATLLLNMSTWKSTSSLVAMDITGGSLKVGDNITTISGGHAYYLINHPRLIVFGYVVDNTSNTTGVKVLKVFAVSMNETSMPTKQTDNPLSIHILAPESKLASEWFLSMDGQVKMA